MNIRKTTSIIVLFVFVLLSSYCTNANQALLEDIGKTVGNEMGDIAQTEIANLKETSELKLATLGADVKTEVPSAFGTVLAQLKTEAPSVFGTLVNQQSGAVFNLPSTGFIGLKYREPYPDGTLHTGIDIWASKTRNNNNEIGSPVYAVLGGNLGRTGSGVEICHKPINETLYPNLPNYLICTYYGHLTNFPEKIAALPKDSCPNNLIPVTQGELLGYMDTPNPSNNQIVHLHFSVAKQNLNNGCWTNETILTNTVDPFPYLQLKTSDYDWLSEFP